MCTLGDDELVAMLRWVPQAQRLGACSLVSTQFRRAATAATIGAINVRAASLNSSSFRQWLRQHGHAVKGMQVVQHNLDDWEQTLPVDVLQQLPDLSSLLLGDTVTFRDTFWQQLQDFPSLTQLSVRVHHSTPVNVFTSALPRIQHLRKLTVKAEHAVISSSEASVFSQLTILQQLSLDCHTLEPVALQRLTQLEDLSLSASRLNGANEHEPALLSLLSQLTHLTQLQLSSKYDIQAGSSAATVPVWCTAFAAITTSSRLRHLKLHLPLHSSAWQEVLNSAAQLPALLTLEAFAISTRPLQVFATQPSSAPGLAQLTSLQELRLFHCELEADVLSSLTQLSHLGLFSATVTAPGQHTCGTGALLAALSYMQQLQHLNLANAIHKEQPEIGTSLHATGASAPDLLLPRTSAAYTALLASSNLQSLWVLCELPPGTWDHAFSIHHTLPRLTSLNILLDVHQGCRDGTCETPLSTEAVAAMCSRCWNLQVARFAVQPEASLAPLQQLHALIKLELAGVSRSMLGQLAGLRQLRHLSLGCDSTVSLRNMLQLTTLTCLTHLCCDKPGLWRWLLLQKMTASCPTVAHDLVAECAKTSQRLA